MAKKSNTEEFIVKAQQIHNNIYDYSEVNYHDAHSKILIKCYKHGKFLQTPISHLAGHDCPKCVNETRGGNQTKLLHEFVEEAKEMHGEKYNYSKTIYKGIFTKIIIICPCHGEFLQTPYAHLHSNGCRRCSGLSPLTTEEFIERAKETHNNKYDYSKSEYKNATTKIKIICIEHGEFLQMPPSHLSGAGCPKCSRNISNPETKWLDTLGIPNEYRNKFMYIEDTRIKPDAYDPITNTIYEYNGDFWHGNPAKYNPADINPKNKKTYGELYEETLSKRKLIQEAGYNLIEIWESEWKLLSKS